MRNKEERTCDSIEDIIDVYGNMVYRIVLHHMGNEADAQDVLQDIFIKIMKKKPIFENIYKEKAWILQVAMNTCKDQWKYNRLRKHEELIESYGSNSDSNKSFEILPYVISLPQKYRDVIYLYYYEEYSIKEVAQILAKKPTTINTWLNRARKILKQTLKGSEWYEEI